MNAPTPNKIAQYFFQALMNNQLNMCWSLFSQKSQQEFLKYTHQAIHSMHGDAAQMAKLGLSEIKLMFESPDPTFMKTVFTAFWKRFFYQSNTNDFFRYGYFTTASSDGKQAIVEAKLVYPEGRTKVVQLKMFHQRGGWRLGYIESELPF